MSERVVCAVIECHVSDLDGIIVTAAEGGINYWARIRNYKIRALDEPEKYPDGCSMEVQEDEVMGGTDPLWVKVDRMLVAKGIQVMAEKYPHQLRALIASGSCGDYAPDAEVCDVIVQCGVFGEIVYG